MVESTELDVLVKTAIAKIEAGTLTMEALLEALAPDVPPAAEVEAQAPMPVAITPEQREAITKVGEVFGKVVPTERRTLQATEVASLIEEKQTLDELKKMAEARHESIRTTVFNHFDVEAEAEGKAADAYRDKRGHYILTGEARATPEVGKKFTREVRQQGPSLNASALEALARDDDFADLTWDDYLKMTTQVRVVDENKVMLALKKKPDLVKAIARATNPGSRTASLNLRKA